MGVRIFHRGRQYRARTPQGPGKSWVGTYGFLSQTAFGQPYGPDGLNEAGLYCGMFMLTGDMSAKPFSADDIARSLSVGDFMQWALSSFTTVAQVREQLELLDEDREFAIVDMKDPSFPDAQDLSFHWKFQDKTNASFVLEIVDGGVFKIYDTEPMHGVITNNPTYDFHLRNLENYAFLESEAITVSMEGALGRRFCFGMPGDYKSAGRFIRAHHLTRAARPLSGALDVVRESFRILSSFDIPLGAAVPHDEHHVGTLGACQVTSASDVTNTTYYYKTMKNHRIRKIDLRNVDWAALREDISFPMDEDTKEDYLDVSPMRLLQHPQSRL